MNSPKQYRYRCLECSAITWMTQREVYRRSTRMRCGSCGSILVEYDKAAGIAIGSSETVAPLEKPTERRSRPRDQDRTAIKRAAGDGYGAFKKPKYDTRWNELTPEKQTELRIKYLKKQHEMSRLRHKYGVDFK